jgi:hypothetical protein
MIYSIGDITKDGGKVTRLIPARELIDRWRQNERVNDMLARHLFDLLKRQAEEHAEIEKARWEEIAKAAGYESLDAAHLAKKSFVIEYGTGEIIEIEQSRP